MTYTLDIFDSETAIIQRDGADIINLSPAAFGEGVVGPSEDEYRTIFLAIKSALRDLSRFVESTEGAAVWKAPTMATIDCFGRTIKVHLQREDAGSYWATRSEQNSDQGYTLEAGGRAYRDRYRNGERVTRTHVGTWKLA